jgi:hypothetical protein
VGPDALNALGRGTSQGVDALDGGHQVIERRDHRVRVLVHGGTTCEAHDDYQSLT